MQHACILGTAGVENPAHSARYEDDPWLIKTLPDGSTKVYKPNGDEVNILKDIPSYLD